VSLSAADGGREDFHIAVRAAVPTADSAILLMYPATTGQAYNPTAGASLYEFNSPGGVPADRVSFDRPGGLEYGLELPIASWFDAAGIATEACTSLDLHENQELPRGYRLVVSMGHDEYWSREMRDALEDYVTRGGNVASFSGNVCWWQVRVEDGGRVMVCHKDAATDPFAGVDDGRVTVNWADFPVCRPENALTDVGWRRGAQVSKNGAFNCRFPEHWVFAGTGLAEGDEFGTGFAGYETDACAFEEIDGRPRVTGADGRPVVRHRRHRRLHAAEPARARSRHHGHLPPRRRRIHGGVDNGARGWPPVTRTSTGSS
jgi:hypothetical protein